MHALLLVQARNDRGNGPVLVHGNAWTFRARSPAFSNLAQSFGLGLEAAAAPPTPCISREDPYGGLSPASISLPEGEHGVEAAEREGVRQRRLDLDLARAFL